MPEAHVMKAVITLGVSFVAIIGLYVLIRKYAGKTGALKSTGEMKIISKMSLPPKNFIYMIEIAGKKMLIGVNEKSITKLADIEEEKVLPNENSEGDFAGINYQDIVNSSAGSGNAGKELGFTSFLKSFIRKN